MYLFIKQLDCLLDKKINIMSICMYTYFMMNSDCY